MRIRLLFRPHGQAVMLLALLFGAATPAARAAEPPPPGVLMGAVVRVPDGAPMPFAQVVDTVSRIGTSADETGRFVLAPLAAGPHVIRIQTLGGAPLFESLELAPGDTVRRTYRIEPPAHDRFLLVRDSLSARGLWPPALDPALFAHMRDALDVRVYRLDPEHPLEGSTPDPARHVGRWPILAEARRPPRPLTDELIATLRHPDLYLPNLQGMTKLCGGFSPLIAVRFISTGVAVDLLLCYTCGEFSLQRDGRSRQAGDFEDKAADFVRFAKRMFPDDRIIRKLGRKPSGTKR